MKWITAAVYRAARGRMAPLLIGFLLGAHALAFGVGVRHEIVVRRIEEEVTIQLVRTGVALPIPFAIGALRPARFISLPEPITLLILSIAVSPGAGQQKKAKEDQTIRVAVEMVGVPGYQGDHTDYCMKIIQQVGSPRMKLLFDIYHVQIMNGDVIRRIRQYRDVIAHYHTAGVPGRGGRGRAREGGRRAALRGGDAEGVPGRRHRPAGGVVRDGQRRGRHLPRSETGAAGSGRLRESDLDTGAPLVDIGHVIQLAVAPVFLLSGIGIVLTVLTNRLARVVDRARKLEEAGIRVAIGHDALDEKDVIVTRYDPVDGAIVPIAPRAPQKRR